jgi:hypothetical protein
VKLKKSRCCNFGRRKKRASKHGQKCGETFFSQQKVTTGNDEAKGVATFV